MRAPRLTVLAATAALLGACAGSGIRSEGGDVFTLRTDSLSGSRAVEHGLAEARDFCAANGRQLVVQDSRIGSGSYQLMFRCVAPFGTAGAGGVDPLLAAAATPPAASTGTGPGTTLRRRTRRAATAETASLAPAAEPVQAPTRRARRVRPAEAPAAQSSSLQPIPQETLPSRFARTEPAQPEAPALPPVATTPLFNPRGASFPGPVATPTRQIPADAGPFAPVQPAVAQRAAIQQPAVIPAPAAPRAAASDALPPIQIQPPVASGRSGAPVATSGYGASVPSAHALPGASSALSPIAAPGRPVPSATPSVNPNTPPTGFFSAPGR